MGFFSDLWEGIKAPFRFVYDKAINPVVSGISNVYDKVKGFLPTSIRAPLDAIQGTVKQGQDIIQKGRDVLGAVGLKDGGMVEMPRKKFQA